MAMREVERVEMDALVADWEGALLGGCNCAGHFDAGTDWEVAVEVVELGVEVVVDDDVCFYYA